MLGCEPLDDAPIFDLRIRKGVRRHGVKLAIATVATERARPERAAVGAHTRPAARPSSWRRSTWRSPGRAAGGSESDAARLAELLRDGGEDVVILWGERSLGAAALGTLLSIAERLGLAGRDGAGLLEIPAGANGRGLREAGVLPGTGPGYSDRLRAPGRGGSEIAQAAVDGEITALYLFQTDPVRDRPDRALWERALHRAGLVVAHASVLTEGLAEHANVIFPADSYAEKEGTVVHPDGRLQRLRTAIAHPGSVRAGWSVIAELGQARRARHRRADLADGVRAARRGGPVLPRV